MRRLAASLILIALVAPIPGCAGKSEPQSRAPVTSSIENLRMTPRELRIRVRALIRPTLGLIEEGADRVLADVTDPRIRRGALIWKIESTTTLMSALLRDDPVLAIADAFGYVIQLQEFVDRPEFRDQFGPLAVEGEATLGRVYRLLYEFADGVQEDLSADGLVAAMREWAAKNPIEGSIYRRPSLDSAVADLFAIPASRGAFAALGSLEETTAEVMMRMDLYTVYLPRLARWEAQVALVDVLGGADLEAVGGEFERFTHAADRIAGVAESASSLVAREREAAFDAVREERLAATEDLRAERRAILDAVRAERVATLVEIEAIVARSGGSLHEAVRGETDRLVVGVEEMRERLNYDARDALNMVVDHAFVRALQLLLIAAVLLAIGVVLHARFLRPHRGAA